MNPSKLPSYQHHEFVKTWLASAQLEPTSTTRCGTDDERGHKSVERPLHHLSPNALQLNSISGDCTISQVVRQSRVKSPKKRQTESQSSPPALNRAHYDPREPLNHQESLHASQSAARERRRASTRNRTSRLDQTASEVGEKRRPEDPESNETKHDPSRRYARRPRRKTRDDRYEYKSHEEVKKVQKIAGHNKRSARRKSGAMLNNEFRAPNVESERLTLKHPSGLGFLGKGRASNQAPPRGLPDLTFSEMAFLSKRREPEAARIRSQTKQESTKEKAARGSAQEISGFFALPMLVPATDHRVHGPPGAASEQSHVSRNLPSPVDVAYERAMTGVSLDGQDQELSTARNHGAADCETNWHPDSYESRIQHFRPRVEGSLCQSNEEKGTSYTSWSPSIESVPVRRHRGPDQHDVTRRIQDIYPVHPRSSVSNIRPRHGRDVPSKHQPSTQTPGASATPLQASGVLYHLDDLKILARNLSSIEGEDSYHVARHRAEPLSSQGRKHYPATVFVMNGNMDAMRPVARPVDNQGLGVLAEEIVDDDLAQLSRQHVSYEGCETDSWLPPHHRGVCRDSHRPQNTDSALWHAEFTGEGGSAVDSFGHKRPEEPFIEVFARPSDNCNYAASGPEMCRTQDVTSKNHTNGFEDDGLDTFDLGLLVSAQTSDLDLHPDFDNAELASHLGWRASHRNLQQARAVAEHETKCSEERLRDRGATRQASSYPEMHFGLEADSQPRPRLLRPSEDERLEAQPFTGFSRPWKLY